MTILGTYCKAYPLHQLRQFPGWAEKPDNARMIRREVDGETVEVARQLTDADYVYLQRNFTVTDGIFIDENVIFSDVTPEWIAYCCSVLGLRSQGSESENYALSAEGARYESQGQVRSEASTSPLVEYHKKR